MKYVKFRNILFASLILLMMVLIGCDDNPSKPDEEIVVNDIDVRLINNWDLYEISYDSLKTTNRDFQRENGGYPVLAEEFYLVVTANEIFLGDNTFTSSDENVEKVNLQDNQLYTVTVDGDTLYHYDYYRNTDTGALWVIEDNTSNSYLAVDPTETDTVYVVAGSDTVSYAINIDDYMLFYIHGSGPELNLLEPEYNTQVSTLTPSFSWDSNNASEYRFQLRTDTLFSSVDGFIYNEILQSNSFNIPATNSLQNFTTYYWRVKADNSDWSEIWNFGTYYNVILSSPLNTERVVRKPTMTWQSYNGATEYTIQIATNPIFTEDLIEVTTANTNYTHGTFFEDGLNYYWHVKADNSNDVWSDTRYFTIQKAVSLSSPVNEEMNVSIPVIFEWDALQNASEYTIEVADDEEMQNILINETTTDNSYTDSLAFVENSQYFWRVISDVATDYSEIYSFYTNQNVMLLEPENNSVDVGVIVQFSWNELASAQTYTVQVSDDVNFSNIVVQSDPIEETSFIPEIDFDENTTYYWKVQRDSLEWSDVWSFTTGSLIDLDDIEPTSPDVGSTNISQTATLNWPSIDLANYYRLQVATDPDFNDIVIQYAGTASDYSITEDEALYLATEYFWRIRSDNSTWCDTWSFTTETGVPSNISVSVQPETPQKVDISWNDGDGLLISYNIERSTDGSTWELIAEVSPDYDYYVDFNLDENQLYYYRMYTANPVANSAYSDVLEVTTGTFELPDPSLSSVSAGTFTMGTDDGDDDEMPVRAISLTNDMQIGNYEVTNQEYVKMLNWALGKGMIKGLFYNGLNYATGALDYDDLLLDPDNSDCKIEFYVPQYKFRVRESKEDYPVVDVTWKGAAAYANWLSQALGFAPLYDTSWNCTVYGTEGFRLPTEAEWEYAAKEAGSSNNYTYSGSNTVGDVAWYIGNTSELMAVGTRAASGIGTFDMSGNVWEWCNDYYGTYDDTQLTNPVGPSSGTYRVIRGGSWEYEEYYLRNTNRSQCKPDLAFGRVNTNIGFRIVKILP